MSDRLPKLCFHKATGRYYVTLNGREVYLGTVRAKAVKERDRILGEWLAAGRRLASSAAPADLTIAELVAQYEQHAERYYRKPDGTPSGHLAVVKSALRHLMDTYRHQPAVSFGPVALRSLRDSMIAAGLTRTYINGHVHRIRLAFKWAASRELVPIETYQRLTTVEGLRKGRSDAREPGPVVPVEDWVIDATLKFLPHVMADMVRVQRLAGMRPGEVCLMRPCEIDRTADVWLYTPATHKTEHHNHQRRVFIGPKCQRILKKYLLRLADSYCFSPTEVVERLRQQRHENRQTPMSCGNVPGSNRKKRPGRRPGPFYKRASYSRAIRRAADMADAKAHKKHPDRPADERLVPRWHPHQLRHTRATELRGLYGIEAVATALGHSRMPSAEIYAERDWKLAATIAREVG